ncbi:MAG: tripartite tricarboxylate transporter substrate-binding protein [Polaromonas sp.]|uniref:tripartite tricarboxylate transporter substrate-binding protein n=1 Tax=Polaromonas sp. TaxID=1869339 RepID=UPI00272EE9C0|nr:tripartite tricarboxylate transporter substrate-binding protein [Polaromonas sp.]MDP2257197.1 tripartite tricarboxylate transporter substrate-binding protein [Polaromonas sp.]
MSLTGAGGAAPAMQDLLGGQVDFMFDPGIRLNHVRADKLKLLAVGSPKRSPLFPDVPTLSEIGLKAGQRPRTPHYRIRIALKSLTLV